jgi:hypothetical protein
MLISYADRAGAAAFRGYPAVRDIMRLRYAGILILAALFTGTAVAKDLDKGWWVIVATFPAEQTGRMQSDFDTVNAAAARCGVQTFNDFSGKFRGFAPGYNVFVLGAYPSPARAKEVADSVRGCFAGAYVKYGEHLGE